MVTKCPKCGGELEQTTTETAKCSKCGTTFKIKSPSGGQAVQKKGAKKKGKQAKKEGKHKVLKTIAIVIFGLAILGAILPESEGKSSSKQSKSSAKSSIWAEEDTDLEDFEYYIDGDKIHINGYNGRGKKVKIGKSYDVDGRDMDVKSVSDAPFLTGVEIESAIISEGITTLDANTFNSCGVKYVFLPSTLQNLDKHFWGYFLHAEKIYYGGTQEQWRSICTVAREDIDCKQIYCNVKVEELGKDDSEKESVSMNEEVDSETSDLPVESEQNVEENENLNVPAGRTYGSIQDFSYGIQGDTVSLGRYNGSEDIIEIRPTYVIDGVEYRTDISDFQCFGGSSIGTIIIDEGISEVNTAIFNSSRVHTIFFPRSMTNIYDYTLSYLHPSDGQLTQIYYGGTQDEWNAIFRHYERTKVEDAWAGKDPEQIGHSIADKLNEMIGVDYNPEEFEYHFSASPEELKQ